MTRIWLTANYLFEKYEQNGFVSRLDELPRVLRKSESFEAKLI